MTPSTSRWTRARVQLCQLIIIVSALLGASACEPEIQSEARALAPAEPAQTAEPRATLRAPGFASPAPRAANPTPPRSTERAGPCVAGNCHAELHQNEHRFKHQPYVDERCLDCHKNFHAPMTQRARIEMELDLCYTCHTRAALGNTHPVGEGIIDPNTKQMMTCTSTCHRSHTAPYRYLLTLSGEGALCVNCHKEFIK